MVVVCEAVKFPGGADGSEHDQSRQGSFEVIKTAMNIHTRIIIVMQMIIISIKIQSLNNPHS